ncbi:A24 family peptidase [Gloeocapsa sp. PCC 73106]|uniref:prepilin peptidase n=1 Tax=Gloeocapsa sp. PCC 73106 TaxID=102232 RepID=UPI0002ABC9A2|nr:prepilin signal peptidase PulO-like peptidase [Gloeocapsa sp. PCC 73106]
MPTSAIANLIIDSFIFIFGAAIGSFLNVVVYRLPAQISLISPPSRCPQCFHKLGNTENIPILGWLYLRGRCRWCQTPISWRYPALETLCALLFVFVFWQFGFSWLTLGYWVFMSWLLALALIDLDTMTLPNVLTQSGLVIGLIFRLIPQGSIPELMEGITGAVLGIWLFELIILIGTIILGQVAMGGGDPKLAAMIGAWLGWKYLLLTGFIACFLGAIIGGAAIALGWLSRRQAMPFGPFLVMGAAFSLFYGSKLISTYLNLFFPS